MSDLLGRLMGERDMRAAHNGFIKSPLCRAEGYMDILESELGAGSGGGDAVEVKICQK